MDNAPTRCDLDSRSRLLTSAHGDPAPPAGSVTPPAAPATPLAALPGELVGSPGDRSGPGARAGEALSTRDITLELADDRDVLATVWLRCEHGSGGAPARFAVAPGAELILGSAPDADIQLDDATVSARHCRVAHRGASIEVTDLGSRNGVRVGGVRVQQAMLVPGGCFEIGRTAMYVEAARRVPVIEEDGPPLPGLIGRSRPMRQLAATVRRVAPLHLPVLLRGESGTGKDVVARAIHAESTRADRPFVVLNAATILRELAESELFGHRRGAFTGAVRERQGAFVEANHGTLFLDEIAALSLEVQAKLLRVVEEGMVRPLGAERATQVNVRLVVATCEPLETLVSERRFRADLYERLAVCRIQLPALRDRPDDIPLLAEHLLASSEIGRRQLSPGALAALRAHRWQGNVRELRNVLIQAALRAHGGVLPEHITAVLADREPPVRRKITPADALRAFEEVGGNVSAAARLADVPRSTMRDLLRVAKER
ncbi:sigma 54-interacting transcriptional regulator [Sorangium sp. So ce375]|uniref:sigma 54-interacting transcriptional regulator n=1 Tax=Sorangium sp. So ce375 TaxID=3133306 RepID=UPI003F5C5202